MVQFFTQHQPLLETACELGEGSLWDAKRQKLYFIDIMGHKIYTYEPSSEISGYQIFDRMPTALALLEDDSGLLVSFHDGPAYVPFESLPFPPTNSHSTYIRITIDIPRIPGFNRFNEACVDPTGKRWMLGSMMHEEAFPGGAGGGLHCVETDEKGNFSARLMLDDITVANGMGWSKDLKTMYFTDSLRKVIGKYDYDPITGHIGKQSVFSDIPDMGAPDGLCQDNEYGCWSARWGASRVVRLSSTGDVDVIVELPKGLNMTSCIFGGPDLDELYVTSARTGMTEEERIKHPHNGHVFVVKGLGYKGTERTRFSGRLPQAFAKNH